MKIRHDFLDKQYYRKITLNREPLVGSDFDLAVLQGDQEPQLGPTTASQTVNNNTIDKGVRCPFLCQIRIQFAESASETPIMINLAIKV